VDQPLTTSETWDKEYTQLHSIPSSTRLLPSKALCIAEPLISFAVAKTALDAGCGNGRNSIYLARKGIDVTAVDLSQAALDATAAVSTREKLTSRIHFMRADLFKPFPYQNQQFDLSLDSYVSCHFSEKSGFRNYWSELTRVTRKGGMIFSSMFSADDEYYANFIKQQAARSIVTDPVNGISKVIYCENEFKSLFAHPLKLEFFMKFQFTDRVHDRDYRRSLLIALLKRGE
jgi:SAM-dependent methyltransferase